MTARATGGPRGQVHRDGPTSARDAQPVAPTDWHNVAGPRPVSDHEPASKTSLPLLDYGRSKVRVTAPSDRADVRADIRVSVTAPR